MGTKSDKIIAMAAVKEDKTKVSPSEAEMNKDVENILKTIADTATICNIQTVGLVALASLVLDNLGISAEQYSNRCDEVVDVMHTDEGKKNNFMGLLKLVRNKKSIITKG